jgi:hypothetical protein
VKGGKISFCDFFALIETKSFSVSAFLWVARYQNFQKQTLWGVFLVSWENSRRAPGGARRQMFCGRSFDANFDCG